MKHILITITAVVLVGCGESQESSTPEVQLAEPVVELSAPQPALPEAQPAEAVAEVQPEQSAPPVEVELAKPVAEVTKQEPPTVKAPDTSITQAAETGKHRGHQAALSCWRRCKHDGCFFASCGLRESQGNR